MRFKSRSVQAAALLANALTATDKIEIGTLVGKVFILGLSSHKDDMTEKSAITKEEIDTAIPHSWKTGELYLAGRRWGHEMRCILLS